MMIMSKSSDRMEKFGEICDRMLELHRGKDAMYGSSFEDVWRSSEWCPRWFA